MISTVKYTFRLIKFVFITSISQPTGYTLYLSQICASYSRSNGAGKKDEQNSRERGSHYAP